MKAPANRKELEMALRRAFEIDRMLPKVGPKSTGTIIGKMMVIPDDERSYEDILEDLEHKPCNLTREDVEFWWIVMSQWLRPLKGVQIEVVKMRVSGMGWKRIARNLVNYGYAVRFLHRQTLWRIFKQALEDVLRNI